MIFPQITAITAAAIALLQMYLMLSVGFARARSRVGIGDGGHESLALLIRRHGNLIENAPTFLILLALIELGGGVHWAVVTLAAVFLIARFAHAIAFTRSSGAHPLRPVGAFGTALSIIGAAVYLLWMASM